MFIFILQHSQLQSGEIAPVLNRRFLIPCVSVHQNAKNSYTYTNLKIISFISEKQSKALAITCWTCRFPPLTNYLPPFPVTRMLIRWHRYTTAIPWWTQRLVTWVRWGDPPWHHYHHHPDVEEYLVEAHRRWLSRIMT